MKREFGYNLTRICRVFNLDAQYGIFDYHQWVVPLGIQRIWETKSISSKIHTEFFVKMISSKIFLSLRKILDRHRSRSQYVCDSRWSPWFLRIKGCLEMKTKDMRVTWCIQYPHHNDVWDTYCCSDEILSPGRGEGRRVGREGAQSWTTGFLDYKGDD